MPLNRREDLIRGIICGVTSAFFFSLMAYFVQIVGKKLPNSEILLTRSLCGIVFFGRICGNQIKELFKVSALPVWLRALFGSISVYLYYLNIRSSTLATATVLTDLAPIFVLFFSVLIFKARVTLVSTFGTVLAVSGVVYLSSLPEQGVPLLTAKVLIIGFLSAACGAAAYLSLSKATSRYSIYQIVWAFSVPMLLFSFSDRPETFIRPDLWETFLLFGVVVSSFIAQLLLTLSYRYLSTSVASTLGLTASVWAMGFDGLVGTPPGLGQLIGVGVILIGVRFSLVIQKLDLNPVRLPPESPDLSIS